MTGCGDNFNFQRIDAEAITLIEVVVIKRRGSFLRNQEDKKRAPVLGQRIARYA